MGILADNAGCHSFRRTDVVSVADAVDQSPRVSCTPESGAEFPLGDTTVECMATDVLGSSSGSFTVTVQDTTAPETTITAHLIDPSAVSAVIFEFRGTDVVDVAGYECQLNDGGFNACGSPHEYTDSDGRPAQL